MKKGAVDQILLWIVLFIVFVSLLFFVIDYSLAVRVKDNADSLSDYGARMVALGKSEDEIATGLNQIKLPSVTTITAADITCVDDPLTTNYQVHFNVVGTFDTQFITSGENNINSSAVVFNEISNVQRTCTLNLTIN